MDCHCYRTLLRSQSLQETRDPLLVYCAFTGCFNKAIASANTFRVCSRCKRNSYCSTGCQSLHWPKHKSDCTKEGGPGLRRILCHAVHNKFFCKYLGIALAYEFKLDLDMSISRRRGLSRRVFYAQADIGIEPRELNQTIRLFDQLRDWNFEGVDGIVQVNHIEEVKDDQPSQRDLAMWMEERIFADDTGNFDSALVMVDICHNCCTWIRFRVLIDDDTLDAARRLKQTFSNVLPVDGQRRPLFFHEIAYHHINTGHTNDVARCINHLNEHIRYDENNDMGLHMPMRKFDKRRIIEAYTSISYSGHVFTLKLLREPVYACLRRFLGIDVPQVAVAAMATV